MPAAVARNEAPSHIMPINALNSYQNRWTIKARVTNKSDIRRWAAMHQGAGAGVPRLYRHPLWCWPPHQPKLGHVGTRMPSCTALLR